MITRLALLCAFVGLVIASVRTAPLQVSVAQQVTPASTGTTTPAAGTTTPGAGTTTPTAGTTTPGAGTTTPTAGTTTPAAGTTTPAAGTTTPAAGTPAAAVRVRAASATLPPTPTFSPTATASLTPTATPTQPSATRTASASPTLAAAPTLVNTPGRPSPTPTLPLAPFVPFVPPTLIHTPTRTPIPVATTGTATPTPNLVRTTTPGLFIVPTLVRTPATLAPTTGVPPQVLLVSEASITRSSATITWTTNVPTTSEVDYGTGSQLTRSPVDPTLVTSHTIVLTGLSPGTPYAYRVKSLTSTGGLAVSDPGDFVTLPDGSGGDVTGMSVRRVTATTASLAWTTSTGIVAQVEYGPTANYGGFTLLKVFASPTQDMVLTNLVPGTRYHFRVKTWDASGNLAATGDFVFRTALSGPTTLAGDETLFADRGSLDSGQAAIYQYVAAQSGQASVLRLYVDAGTSAAAIRVAVYADQAGGPGAIVAQGSAPGLSPGWVSINIPSVFIMQGQTYWIAVLSPIGGGGVNLRGAIGGPSGLLSRQTTLAAFPAVWTTAGPAARSHISAYLQQVPPAITLTGPGDGDTVSGSVPLSAVVDDDVAVTRLQFYVDGVPVGPALVTAPYTTTWDSSGLSATQPHSITVRASDVAGRSQISTGLTVQVDNGPTISSVALNPGLTASSSRITWTTDALADSQVEFGTTLAYGFATPTDARTTWNHDMQLTGLAPGTLYHYRVRSRDASGALAVSADATFSTTADP